MSHGHGAGVTTTRLALGPNDLHVIGSIGSTTNFRSGIEKLRRRISRHKSRLRVQAGPDDRFDHDLENARQVSADKKSIEEETLHKIENEFAQDVGGVLQKIEAYETGGSTVVAFTRDDRPYVLDHLPMVGPGLGFVPVGERMGRQ